MALPATSTLAPAATASGRRRVVDPAVDLDVEREAAAVELGTHASDLVEH